MPPVAGAQSEIGQSATQTGARLGESATVVGFATAWSSEYGGINQLNKDLMAALAQLNPNHRILCVVPRASAAEHDDATRSGVHLLSLQQDDWNPDSPAHVNRLIQLLAELDPPVEVNLWIGHDLITGYWPLKLRGVTGHGRAVGLMHVSYADYENVKYAATGLEDEKRGLQQQLFQDMDHTFGVGPLLYSRLTDLVGSNATQLIPGLPIRQQRQDRSRLHAVSFGRFGHEDESVKQGRLSVAAFARAVADARASPTPPPLLKSNPRLTLVGIENSEENRRQLYALAEAHAGGAIDLRLVPFVTNKERLDAELDGANLALFLSWHDGFGLAAWEMVGAAVPLIVSKATGVFHFIEALGRHAAHAVLPVQVDGSYGLKNGELFSQGDVARVARAIQDVSFNHPDFVASAEWLRGFLANDAKCKWAAVAADFADRVGLPSSLASAEDVPRLSEEAHQKVSAMVTEFEARELHALSQAANTQLSTGRYDQAIDTLSAYEPNELPDSDVIRVELVRAEARLRLNVYGQAQQHAEAATAAAERVSDYRSVLKAQGIVNTILRDLGRYDEAVQHAREMEETALAHAPVAIGSVTRKLSRCLTLNGEWSEAASKAEAAIQHASGESQPRDKAKALLALGEAHRHGLDQTRAAKAYREAIDLATGLPDWDCYLWSALGLSDSYALMREFDESRQTLEPVGRLVSEPARRFPLETLHWQFSISTVGEVETRKEMRRSDEIVAAYEVLGVKWPNEYLQRLRKTREMVVPKRF